MSFKSFERRAYDEHSILSFSPSFFSLHSRWRQIVICEYGIKRLQPFQLYSTFLPNISFMSDFLALSLILILGLYNNSFMVHLTSARNLMQSPEKNEWMPRMKSLCLSRGKIPFIVPPSTNNLSAGLGEKIQVAWICLSKNLERFYRSQWRWKWRRWNIKPD